MFGLTSCMTGLQVTQLRLSAARDLSAWRDRVSTPVSHLEIQTSTAYMVHPLTCVVLRVVASCSLIVRFSLRLTFSDHLVSVQVLALHNAVHFRNRVNCCLSHTRPRVPYGFPWVRDERRMRRSSGVENGPLTGSSMY
jgi:hypothetical protein